MLTDPILDQNKRLRARVAELEETVRQLRDDMAYDGTLPDGLPSLSPSEEAVLRVLLARRGVVSRTALMNAVHSEAGSNVVDVYISHLRRKLIGTGIKICTRWGRGWYIERATHRVAAARHIHEVIGEAAAV